MPTRPPAARILDQLNVAYELVQFDASVRSAAAIAALEGVEGSMVYKTLVVREEPPGRKPCLVMAPATKELDLRSLARGLRVKKVRMATHTEAEQLTGLKAGGISAITLRDRDWPVYIDADVLRLPAVLVSAGVRGADIRLAVRDLLTVTRAVTVDLA